MNYIKLRKNNLCVENVPAQKLTKKYQTPFYCYSLSQLKSNFENFEDAFRFIKPLICFSIKSNANNFLLKIDNPTDDSMIKDIDANTSNRINAELI